MECRSDVSPPTARHVARVLLIMVHVHMLCVTPASHPLFLSILDTNMRRNTDVALPLVMATVLFYLVRGRKTDVSARNACEICCFSKAKYFGSKLQ